MRIRTRYWGLGGLLALAATLVLLAAVPSSASGGAVTWKEFMESMPDNPGRFLNPQQRDFMYVTLDETNYHR